MKLHSTTADSYITDVTAGVTGEGKGVGWSDGGKKEMKKLLGNDAKIHQTLPLGGLKSGSPQGIELKLGVKLGLCS